MKLSRTSICPAAIVCALVAAPSLASSQPTPPPAVGPVGPLVVPPKAPPPPGDAWIVPDQPPPGQPPRPGQAPQPGQPPPAKAPRPTAVEVPPPSPERSLGQNVNVKIELTISDEGGATPPIKKIVSMTIADREVGQIRSEATVQGVGNVPLHVDARPAILTDGKIKISMSINYNLTQGSGVRMPVKEDTINPWKTEIREQLGIILDNGKPLVVSQSADPLGDRRVTVEVKATILK